MDHVVLLVDDEIYGCGDIPLECLSETVNRIANVSDWKVNGDQGALSKFGENKFKAIYSGPGILAQTTDDKWYLISKYGSSIDVEVPVDIISIVGNDDAFFFVSSNGELYALGDPSCYPGTEKNDPHVLHKIDVDLRVKKVVASDSYSMLLTTEGKIYGSGYTTGYDYPLFGTPSLRELPVQGISDIFSACNNHMIVDMSGTASRFVIENDGTCKLEPIELQVEDVAISCFHTLIRKSDGTVWFQGKINENLPVSNAIWKQIPGRYSQIQCGIAHSLLLDTNNRLWFVCVDRECTSVYTAMENFVTENLLAQVPLPDGQITLSDR